MARVSGEAFVNALQSEKVTFLIGEDRKIVEVAKKILCLKSGSLARLADESNGEQYLPGHDEIDAYTRTGVIDLQQEKVMPMDMFICWCYQVSQP